MTSYIFKAYMLLYQLQLFLIFLLKSKSHASCSHTIPCPVFKLACRRFINLIFFFHYSFTPPMVRPATKYLCRNGYRQTMGSIVMIVAAARTDVGVTALATFFIVSALAL